jgi:hypothetical protein
VCAKAIAMHFFNIATNLTNGPFMIGYENEPDNFYLKGETVADAPQVSCRIFNSKGDWLFSMTRNTLALGNDPKFHIESVPDKLEVKDNEGNLLIKLETREEKGRRVTYVQGNFFDKNGKLAAMGDERGLLVNCPLRM